MRDVHVSVCLSACTLSTPPDRPQEGQTLTSSVLHFIGSVTAFAGMCVSNSLQAAVSLHVRRALGRRGIVAVVQTAMAVIGWLLVFACEGRGRGSGEGLEEEEQGKGWL